MTTFTNGLRASFIQLTKNLGTPFEIGLDNVKRELKKWEKRYEDKMMRDIASLFDLAGFKPVYQEIELDSRFPRHNFPDIGDYDVIAINQPRKKCGSLRARSFKKWGLF